MEGLLLTVNRKGKIHTAKLGVREQTRRPESTLEIWIIRSCLAAKLPLRHVAGYFVGGATTRRNLKSFVDTW